MSMLAEPRRRRKWSLNPRGTIWANDDSKYGQKLMEKMGWTKGSGLGREEQGIKENLAVKFKDDNKGIGYKGSDDEWIKHYEGFENVLASLNSQDNNTANGDDLPGHNTVTKTANGDELPGHNTVTKTSLESSSKASRARVHYHKFTRGKDLSRCSVDDLGCILGSKRAKQLAEVKTAEEEAGSEAGDEVGTVHHSMGVTTIKGCSIQDYFARKMESLRNRARSQPQTLEGEDECGSEEASVERPGLGVSRGAGEGTPDSPAAGEEDGERKKRKKKRKKQQVEAEEVNTGEGEEKGERSLEGENIPKKKKKKRQEGTVLSAADGITGESAALRGTSNEDDDHCEPPLNGKLGKRKKKRKYINTIAEEEIVKAVTVEEKPDIKSNKRRDTHIVNGDNSSLDEVSKYPELAKKKKKRKDKSV